MFKNYIELIKPGIITGNIVLIMGGFFLSSHANIHIILFLYTIIGTAFVIASACVFNNLIDFKIDQKMSRTKNRVLAQNLLKHSNVLIFGLILGIIGFVILGCFVNILSLVLAMFGFFVYVFLYTFFFKRISIHSTLIGSFSGAVPSVIGYTSVANTVDFCFFLLFFTIIFWQMSHFYAIAIFRIKDYENAGIPVLPVVKNIFLVKKHIICYIIFFIISTILFPVMGYVSYKFLFLSFMINIPWLFLACYQFQTICPKKYARQLFQFSIIVIIFFNIFIGIDIIL